MSGAAAAETAREYITPQQSRAADPALSAWVTASAGTGKTKVLTDRVLRLLLEATPPQRILCLTFTRAAAAEMANRINRQLGAWTTLDDDGLAAVLEALTGAAPAAEDLARARRQFATVLDAPGGLKIMTIHAFCQSLLGRFPLEAGIAPHFEVLEERGAAELLRDAEGAVLARARRNDHPALAAALDEVAGHTTEETFAELMAGLRAARGRLRRLVRRHGDVEGLIAETCRVLGVGVDETDADVVAAACAEGAFNRAALAAACAALETGSAADRARAAAIAAWIGAPEPERRAAFDDYAAVYLTRDGSPRATNGLMTKPVREGHPEAFKALEVEQKAVATVRERRNAVAVARATAALLRLGAALLDAYDRHKAARARLDYDDLILGARDLLRGAGAAAWVLYKLDRGIDHILVDEAQDTSPEQWEVIAALADEFYAGAGASEVARTVFVVGDEKQSIFSFQGADLRALEAMRARFAERVRAADRDWQDVELGESFRSTAPVLDAVDAVFAQAHAREGVTFADHAIRHRARRKGHAGRVELWPLVAPGTAEADAPWAPPVTRRAADNPRDRLARHVADTIAGWLADGERLDARDRPIRPGDVMVLVRTRTAFVEALVRALKTRDVAVAGTDRMVLAEQLAVMDLVALGEFLLLPEDDLTLATVLKGPLFGFDDDDLFALAHGRGDGLWRTLGRHRRERSAFAAAHRELSALLARADYAPPYEFYAELLAARDGRRRLVGRLGVDANDPIDEFLSLALAYERTGPPSLQGFLHWLAAGGVEIKRDLEHGRDEVRVMTVHGAKGLQAPIVILPDTASLPSAGGPTLLWHEDGGREALLWPPRKAFDEACCRAAREAARERAMQEYRRLLYVAMTRAEDRLYVCGHRGPREVSDECWFRLIEPALDAVGEAVDFAGWRGAARRIDARQSRPAAAEAAAARGPEPEPLDELFRRPPPREPAPPRPLAPSRPAAAEPPALSPVAGDAARFRRGRLVHRLLQVLPEVAPEARAAACRRLLAGRLERDAAEAVAAEVAAVLDDPRFAPLFGPGSRAEAPLVGVVGGAVVAGQVDRLVIGPDTVTVVDYKTNRAPPADDSEVPPAYLAQMAAYRAVLARVFPDKRIVCALLWTDGPHLMELGEAALAAKAP